MRKSSLYQGEIDLKRFEKIKRLSRGGFGIVYQVEDKKTKKLYAAKIIDCEDNKDKCKQMIQREISIMMYAKHSTIIKFIGYSKLDFQGENNVTIIMEFAKNGSLRDVLKKIQEGDGPKDYTNTSRQIILIGVARGMKYLHDRNIIHRDLKTDNILLDGDFHPLVTDFGLSKFFEVGQTCIQTKFAGTLPYEAPEILRKSDYDIKVDVFSYAILMFEVLTDSVPYPELEKQELADFDFMNKVVNENYRPKFNFPIKESFQNLIEKCWSDDPSERPTFDEIFSKLANKNNDDFMLDDVDVDEINLYIDDITEVTDSTEKLLKRIDDVETENKKFKNENVQLKNENVQLKNENVQLKNENMQLKNENVQIKNENMQLKNENMQIKNENVQLKNDKKNLLDKIKDIENDKKQLADEIIKVKKELDKIKSEQKQINQSVIVGGYDDHYQISKKPNKKDSNGYLFISPPTKLSFDHFSLLSYSTYDDHSVLVMSDGSLKGVGNNKNGIISSTLQKTVIKDFTDFSIKDSSGRQLAAVSAVCYEFGTLYMFSKSNNNERQLVLCDWQINGGEPVFLDIGNHHPVALFGGYYQSAAIGSEGEVIFINRNSVKKSPKSPIEAVSLPDGEKASSVACCDDSIVVLSSNGRVFTSPIKRKSSDLKFSAVSELSGHEIVCVSGTDDHFLAVSKEGRVFGRGSNCSGQLGLGKEKKSVSSFTEISSLFEYEIRAAYAGSSHSLFETREGKILSCGYNQHGQLLLSNIESANVYSPMKTTITKDAAFCIAGYASSVVFIGSSQPPNTPNTRIQKYK